MSHINGIKLIRELIKIRPSFPVVLVSGTIKGTVEEQAMNIGTKALIRKPFTRLELANTLFSIINSRENSHSI
jgi:CheY-like chemotaxis protein